MSERALGSDRQRAALALILTNAMQAGVLLGLLHLSADQVAGASLLINSTLTALFVLVRPGAPIQLPRGRARRPSASGRAE